MIGQYYLVGTSTCRDRTDVRSQNCIALKHRKPFVSLGLCCVTASTVGPGARHLNHRSRQAGRITRRISAFPSHDCHIDWRSISVDTETHLTRAGTRPVNTKGTGALVGSDQQSWTRHTGGCCKHVTIGSNDLRIATKVQSKRASVQLEPVRFDSAGRVRTAHGLSQASSGGPPLALAPGRVP